MKDKDNNDDLNKKNFLNNMKNVRETFITFVLTGFFSHISLRFEIKSNRNYNYCM